MTSAIIKILYFWNRYKLNFLTCILIRRVHLYASISNTKYVDLCLLFERMLRQKYKQNLSRTHSTVYMRLHHKNDFFTIYYFFCYSCRCLQFLKVFMFSEL